MNTQNLNSNENTVLDLNNPENQKRFHAAIKQGANLKNTKAAKTKSNTKVAIAAGAGVAVAAAISGVAYAHNVTNNEEADDNNEWVNKEEHPAPQQQEAAQPKQQAQQTEQPVEEQKMDKKEEDHPIGPKPGPHNPDDPELEVIAVVHDDETNQNIALISVNGQPAYLIDFDNDMVFDALIADTDQDNVFSDNEIHDIREAGIRVEDLGGFTDPSMLAAAEAEPDYQPNGFEQDVAAVDQNHDYAAEREAERSFVDESEDEIEILDMHKADESEVEILGVVSDDNNPLEVASEEVYVIGVENNEQFDYEVYDNNPVEASGNEADIADQPVADELLTTQIEADNNCSYDAPAIDDSSVDTDIPADFV